MKITRHHRFIPRLATVFLLWVGFLPLCPNVRSQAPGTYQVLHSFSAIIDPNSFTSHNADGAGPMAALAFGPNNMLYGTAPGGGSAGKGTAFAVSTTGGFDLLYNFATMIDSKGNVLDGSNPATPLLPNPDGGFFGTTETDGANDAGTIFRLDGSALTTVVAFQELDFVNGEYGPIAAISFGKDGNLYGTTSAGGTVFQLTSKGVFSTLYDFNANGQGESPTIIQAGDGNLYGTINSLYIYGGGGTGVSVSAPNGAIFQLTTAGVLKILHIFTGSDGATPYASLLEGKDGALYGLADNGGANSAVNGGTFFKITTEGEFTLLHSFAAEEGDGDEGIGPVAPLIQGKDGNFYGTAYAGGNGGSGTIFEVTPAGAVTTLYTFTQTDANFINSDGAFPYAALVQGPDGTFYGTTSLGGPNSTGAVFSFLPAPSAPTITSAGTIAATAGTAFSFQVTATNTPTHFAAIGLPKGLTINSATGLIGGSPSGEARTYSVTISASNAAGTGKAMLELTVALPKAVLKALMPSADAKSGAAGEFLLTLSAKQNKPVVISYKIAGTAINGKDYALIKDTDTIKAGKTSRTIEIVPLRKFAGTKVVELTLKSGPDYTVETRKPIKVEIIGGE